jgi:hypothetical protein
MIDKELEQITEEDLQKLITNEVAEGRTLDYKEKLSVDNHSEKIEFYKDVSSFANAFGGDIIYGIAEDPEARTPKELKGLELESSDEQIAKLSDMIKDGIEPRIIPAPKIQPVNLSNGKTVIIIRIYRSWTAPHRIHFNNNHKFWIRANNNKHEMDVTELRNAFDLSGNMKERIQKFRIERMQKILTNEAPILLPQKDSSFLILHLIPLSSFHPEPQYFDIKKIKGTLNKYMVLMEPYQNGMWWNSRNNFDGFLAYQTFGEYQAYYVQFFRNGILESLRTRIVKLREGYKTINGNYIEEILIQATKKYVDLLKQLDTQPPILLFLTLTNVKDVVMYMNETQFIHSSRNAKIHRDILQIPELVIESFDIPVEKLLKPVFDMIWNACGYDGSPNYNNEGERIKNNQ